MVSWCVFPQNISTHWTLSPDGSRPLHSAVRTPVGTTLWEASLAIENSGKTLEFRCFFHRCSCSSHLNLHSGHILRACLMAMFDYRRRSPGWNLLNSGGGYQPLVWEDSTTTNCSSEGMGMGQKCQWDTSKIGLVRCGQMLKMPGNAQNLWVWCLSFTFVVFQLDSLWSFIASCTLAHLHDARTHFVDELLLRELASAFRAPSKRVLNW